MAEPAGVTISFTEEQGFQALGQFLQAVCAPSPITVIRQRGQTIGTSFPPGANTGVPEPADGDFVVMSSLGQERLEFNETTFEDNILTASISGTTLTVTSVGRGSVPVGALLRDTAQPTNVAPNTVILSRLSGVPGGIGQYQVSVSQVVLNEVMYAGVRSDLVGSKWTIQLDVHGPNSMQNARTIDALFFSEYATDFFGETGLPLAPLHSGEARQVPFINAEQQAEYRWTIDVAFETGAVVGTPQQFADEVKVKTIEAAAIYTG